MVESLSGSALAISNPEGSGIEPTRDNEEDKPEPIAEMIAIFVIILIAVIAALSLVYWPKRRRK